MCVLILLVSTYCTVWLTSTSMASRLTQNVYFLSLGMLNFFPPHKIKVIISLIYVILTQFSRDALLSDRWQERSCICLAAVFCHPSLYKNNIFRENVWKKNCYYITESLQELMMIMTNNFMKISRVFFCICSNVFKRVVSLYSSFYIDCVCLKVSELCDLFQTQQ